MVQPGKVIFLDGASSSGKSTLAKTLQVRLPEPFMHFSMECLATDDVLPNFRFRNGEFNWADRRAGFFHGFHRCIPALAWAGNNLIVEHIIETMEWRVRLERLLDGLDVFLVNLRCPLDVLEQREIARGDRPIGDAAHDFETIHSFGACDLEIDSTKPIEVTTDLVLRAWIHRAKPGEFV